MVMDVDRNIERFHRIQMEVTTLQNDRKMRDIINVSQEAFVLIDGTCTIYEWNKSAERMFGFETKEVIGKNLSRLILPENMREQFSEDCALYNPDKLANFIGKHVEMTALRRDGSHLDIEMTGNIYQNGKTYFPIFIRDITEAKAEKAETEEREEKIKSANRELELFAYMVAHDIQDPLRSSNAFAKLMDIDKMDEGNKEKMNIILSNNARMLNFVARILQLARLDLTVKYESVDTSEIINEVCRSLSVLMKEKRARIIIKHLPIICIDRVQISQLFQNIMQNAFKYNKPAIPPVVMIDCEEDNKNYLFSFQDNGIGIEPESLPDLFAFHEAFKKQRTGTGLGTAIIRKIVDRFGGSVWAESVLGEGTTVRVRVPKVSQCESSS